MDQFIACVNCLSYNHKLFIKEALDGICAQKTDFPFVCVIVDDASTDGSDNIIKDYLQDQFEIQNTSIDKNGENDDFFFLFGQHKINKNCYFAIYLLHYNHYQKRKSKSIYLNRWASQSKYVAWCEGDDYWISLDKLQRQVSFLDSHSSYSMTCTRTYLYSEVDHKIVGENYCYSHSRKITIKDTIYRGGLFISTCSIVYRRTVSENAPEYWINNIAGDYPLQIACVLKGDAWFFNEPMCVYRINNPNSWLGSKKWYNAGADPEILKVIKSSIHMFKGFAIDYPQYSRFFKIKIAEEINRYVPTRNHNRQVIESYLDNFKAEINSYPLFGKIDLMFRKSRIPKVRGLYQLFISRRFACRNRMYR